MFKLPFVLLYTAMTFFAWGVYGVLLNFGQKEMRGSYLMPFIGVGFAYFVIAVLGAGAMLGGSKEKGNWSFLGTVYSLLAGAVGALGALGVILALANGGDPVYVMPLIFGGAPVINTLFTSWLNKTFSKITPLFVIGMILVGVGMIGVLSFKPHSGGKHAEPAQTTLLDERQPIPLGRLTALVAFESEAQDIAAESKSETTPSKSKKPFYFFRVLFSVIMAVVCWGTYGPILHLGQMKMGGSRLRPFICVGLAYFGIAVVLPLFMVQLGMDSSTAHLNMAGSLWSIAAGTAGAVGALGIILAFNSGGKPIFVMPLVFGFAPVINTLVSLWNSGQLGAIASEPIFTAALATVIAGAVMVLIFAPKAAHGPKPKDDSKPSPTPEPAMASPIPTNGSSDPNKLAPPLPLSEAPVVTNPAVPASDANEPSSTGPKP